MEVPIHHRARVAGISKYGVWNRLGRGIVDLFAIAWYQRRRVRPVPVEECGAEQVGEDWGEVTGAVAERVGGLREKV